MDMPTDEIGVAERRGFAPRAGKAPFTLSSRAIASRPPKAGPRQ